jgi:hypothetical protein
VALAEEITVTKSGPESIKYGENLTITVLIENNSEENLAGYFEETFSEEVAPVEPKEFVKRQGQFYRPPFLVFAFAVPAREKKEITYTIKPSRVGLFFSPPVTAVTSAGNIASNGLGIEVKCNADGVCEPDLEENNLNCPEDCAQDKPDDFCDYAANSSCDPDCPEGVDPDCQGVVAPQKTENRQTPPSQYSQSVPSNAQDALWLLGVGLGVFIAISGVLAYFFYFNKKKLAS